MHQLRVVEALNLIVKFDIILHNHKKGLFINLDVCVNKRFLATTLLIFNTKYFSNTNDTIDYMKFIDWNIRIILVQ